MDEKVHMEEKRKVWASLREIGANLLEKKKASTGMEDYEGYGEISVVSEDTMDEFTLK